MSVTDRLKTKWKLFCSKTSIRGLVYIFVKKNLSFAGKIAWQILFLMMLTLCIYQSTKNIITYLSFGTKVSITYDTTTNFQFPSITFSSMSWATRSSFGNVSTAAFILAGSFANSAAEFGKLLEEVRIKNKIVMVMSAPLT